MAFKTPDQQANAMLKTREPFKLNKELYPDVEETPYGFIYNVNGHSITDMGAQMQKIMPSHYDSSKDYGWTLEVGGDESFYPSFEEAYKRAKELK